MDYKEMMGIINADTTGIAKGYDKGDIRLFKTIEESLLKINKPQQGDFVLLEDGRYVRLCCTYNPYFQLSNRIGVYVSESCSQASGCTWDSDFDDIERERLVLNNLIPIDELKKGRCWTFSGNQAGASRDVYFEINFKVWKLGENNVK